jgi:TPR repeat protein
VSTQTVHKQQASVGLLSLPMILAGVLGLFCLFPRTRESQALLLSVAAAAVVLLAFACILCLRAIAAGRTLKMDFVPKSAHWVQLIMQFCVYAYWGWYWRPVYHYALLIVAQIVFVYALDMLVCWSRRDRWILGFGPVPIILSTNLFLWFRDDWFFLQFVMVAIGVVAKEFIHWRREGRSAHIFNPSAVGLFIFSVILIATNTSGITWGAQIAETLHRPPNIYLEIFLLGLVVQGLFSVTLVTLSAAAMLCAANIVYTHITGVYLFVDSNIPVSVFLGLHLLVTDPATSPRSNSGKIVFGGLYGAGVFALYGLLSWMGAPRFYDKLLGVPPLNLSVRVLDRYGYKMDRSAAALFKKIHAPRFTWAGTPRQTNLAFMSIWIVLFGAMMATSFVTTGIVGEPHPGADPMFWQQACDAHRFQACPTWVGMLNAECEQGAADACFTMAKVTNLGSVVPRDPAAAARAYGRACDLGEPDACPAFTEFINHGGDRILTQSCDHGEAISCFYLATALHLGKGVAHDDARALRVFELSCKDKYVRACGVLGDMYMLGQGASVNPVRALANYNKSCAGHWGQSCVAAAWIYHRGVAGKPDEVLSQRRFEQGCQYGYRPACRFVADPEIDDPSMR